MRQNYKLKSRKGRISLIGQIYSKRIPVSIITFIITFKLCFVPTSKSKFSRPATTTASSSSHFFPVFIFQHLLTAIDFVGRDINFSAFLVFSATKHLFLFLEFCWGKEERVSTSMEKRIFLLLLLMVFGNQTFIAFCVRVPICAPRSVKDHTFFELRDPTCPLSDEPLHFLDVTEVPPFARKFPTTFTPN